MCPSPPRCCATVASLRGGQTMADDASPKGLHRRIEAQERRIGEIESAMVSLQSTYAAASRPEGDAAGAVVLAERLAQTQGGYDDALLVLRELQDHGPALARLGTVHIGYGVVGERVPRARPALRQRLARRIALPRARPPCAASPLRLPAVLCYRQRQLQRVRKCAFRYKARPILTYTTTSLTS